MSDGLVTQDVQAYNRSVPPQAMHPLTIIGLGSNLGDRRATIEQAMRAIEALPGVVVEGYSSLWRTTPVGGPPHQEDYCNAAMGIRSALAPGELMRHLLLIEASFGRRRSEKDAPRTLDLDLLWIEGQRVHHPDLVVPHPRLHLRSFAMIPLLEVARGAADPVSGQLYATILAEVGTEGVYPFRA